MSNVPVKLTRVVYWTYGAALSGPVYGPYGLAVADPRMLQVMFVGLRR
jgi:hypothetical protein